VELVASPAPHTDEVVFAMGQPGGKVKLTATKNVVIALGPQAFFSLPIYYYLYNFCEFILVILRLKIISVLFSPQL
jgi:hypothetical protein